MSLAQPELTRRLLALGPFYGPILCCIIAVQHWFLFFIQLWRPEDEIEVVRADWDPAEFDKVLCPSCLLPTKPVSHGVPRQSRRTSMGGADVQLCEREERERDQISETQHVDDSL